MGKSKALLQISKEAGLEQWFQNWACESISGVKRNIDENFGISYVFATIYIY
jgi:hypothetical protein